MSKFNPASVAAKIRRLGFPVLSVSPIELEQDGQIDITAEVNMQVGETYLIVNKWIDDQSMRHWPMRTRITDAAADIRAAMQGGAA